MDQIKFVEDSLKKKFTWSILEYLDPHGLKFLGAGILWGEFRCDKATLSLSQHDS